jgi:hypothetical protein
MPNAECKMQNAEVQKAEMLDEHPHSAFGIGILPLHFAFGILTFSISKGVS